MAGNENELWTDAELLSAIEGYVFLLRIERAGLTYSKNSAAELLLANQLKTRNEVSLRYRMRNISAVASELGGPVLSAYSPAERVGTNVRARLRKMLLDHSGFIQLTKETLAAPSSSLSGSAKKAEALARLSSLRSSLDDLERELLGIGHNQPPEPLSDEAPQRSDFELARKSISALEVELEKQKPDLGAASEHASRLLDFGFKVALWLGERATKFTDVALAILAPVAIVHATGLTNELLEALKAVVSAIAR